MRGGTFILKLSAGSYSCFRELCVVKTFIAISLSGRFDNPHLVPQVFVSCHPYAFVNNLSFVRFRVRLRWQIDHLRNYTKAAAEEATVL